MSALLDRLLSPLRRERKAGRLASLDRLTASEIICDLITEGKILPGLHGGTETAAELEGLASWLETELAGGVPPKHLVQVAANAAAVLAARIRGQEESWLERRRGPRGLGPLTDDVSFPPGGEDQPPRP